MKKSKKSKTYKSLIAIAIIVPLLFGISYAYYLAVIKGNSSTIKGTATSNFDINLVTQNDGYITAKDMIPIQTSDIESKSEKGTFSVVAGNNNHKITYSLSLTSISISTNLKVTDFKWELINKDTSVSVATGDFNGTSSSKTLASNLVIDSNSTTNYELRFYILESDTNQVALMNGTFSAKVTLSADMTYNPSENYIVPAPANWYESTPGSLLYALKTNNTLAEPLTTIGDASLATEAVMAATPDDYGTSYYFRGAVENNYIVFANMCWRIVRVTGDGSIKLALYNYNPNSVANPCGTAQDGTTNAFARYNGTTYNSAFNTNYNDNAYVGLMYGTTGTSTYAATHANTNKSTILTNLETWYTSKLSSYSANLADTIWCNDKSTTGLGYGNNESDYGVYTRIKDKNASLICPKDNNGGNLSKFTADDTTNGNGALTYKAGLLTVDEMVYSGTPKWGSSNTTQYLYKNTGGNPYWSLSPRNYSAFARVFGGADDVDEGYVDDAAIALRPSVSLVSGTQITGAGTSSNPYIVNS